jgi:tRNA threonylcarbamoyladenosine biosynthesis protein TsaB
MLALEAGGAVLSAALFEDGAELGQAWLRAPQRQTEQLAPLVMGLLRSRDWKASQVGALACGKGPGSFTGLRSSLAFGAGWALAVDGLVLAPVPTLTAWAEAFAPQDAGEVLVLLDGRRGQAYRARLRREAGIWADVIPPALIDLAADLDPGLALLPLITDLPAPTGFQALPLPPDGAALASAVGRLAWGSLQRGEAPAPWEPEYLRRSEAELLWERLHGPAAAPGA